METLQVSVIIRTFNEEQYIGLLLRNLKTQIYDPESIEIIVVDSGSTDGTLNVVQDNKVRLFELSKDSFTYSKSLNLGIENSRGKCIVILSAHAIPTDNNWLKRLVSHFEDIQVAGVYCRQIPWPDAPWDEQIRLEKMFPYSYCVYSSDKNVKNMYFSNAASCISKELWIKQPFIEIPAAEDRAWALWAILNNYKIVYDSSICVYHSHNENPRRSAKRLIDISRAMDIDKKRKRTFWLNFRNASSMLIKDCLSIFRYKGCKGKRCSSVYYSLSRAFWYFLDFQYFHKRFN